MTTMYSRGGKHPNSHHGYVHNEERWLNRFWARVKKGSKDDCWLWIGFINSTGYGRVMKHRKNKYVHRVSYEILIGPIPEDKRLLHRCDVCNCVNPGHLFLGTYQDNMDDMVAKGRSSGILNWEQVNGIRQSSDRVVLLAEQYNVSTRVIYNVRNYVTYKTP